MSLTNMDGRIEIQKINNFRGMYQNFDNLGGKIKITPNFKGVNFNFV